MTAGMFCARCDKPMTPGQAEQIDIDGGSCAAAPVWVHKGYCRAGQGEEPRRDTYSPVGRGWWPSAPLAR